METMRQALSPLVALSMLTVQLSVAVMCANLPADLLPCGRHAAVESCSSGSTLECSGTAAPAENAASTHHATCMNFCAFAQSQPDRPHVQPELGRVPAAAAQAVVDLSLPVWRSFPGISPLGASGFDVSGAPLYILNTSFLI